VWQRIKGSGIFYWQCAHPHRAEWRHPPGDRPDLLRRESAIGKCHWGRFPLFFLGEHQNSRLITDYFATSARACPEARSPPTSSARGGTLQGIASQYYDSPAYWYLLADANGLSGSEELKEGTSLTIPNRVANTINSPETYGLYNENDIIGSTSPEIITIPKPPKKKK